MGWLDGLFALRVAQLVEVAVLQVEGVLLQQAAAAMRAQPVEVVALEAVAKQ